MTRDDAYARLVEHCDELIRNFQRGQSSLALNRKTRRLIRALLVERANRAVWSAENVQYVKNGAHVASQLAIRAAVLRRPQTRRGK